MPSTPKHMFMYQAFNWEPPVYAHVGLLQDPTRQKLSKRDLSSDIREMEREGIFPEALVNYVALFGWSHRLGNDFISLHDLINNVRAALDVQLMCTVNGLSVRFKVHKGQYDCITQ